MVGVLWGRVWQSAKTLIPVSCVSDVTQGKYLLAILQGMLVEWLPWES